MRKSNEKGSNNYLDNDKNHKNYLDSLKMTNGMMMLHVVVMIFISHLIKGL
jgi:hypothetical protein